MNTAITSLCFAHLSDPHLSSLDGVRLRQLLNQRLLGYLSWRHRRRGEHRQEVLDALVHDLAAQQPDQILITGDLTHLGLPEEFQQVAHWLRQLGPPAAITVIPGNHDTYIPTTWRDTFAWWAPYMASDAAPAPLMVSGDHRHLFPSLRIRGPVAFIGLSSAHHSPPFFASGRLGRAQLRRLHELLVQTGTQQLFRIVLLHHPPIANAVAWRKRLTDQAALRALLRETGVELVLHGHAHVAAWEQLPTLTGTAPVIGVPSASAIGHKPGRRACYHLHHLQRGPRGWQLYTQMRAYSPPTDRFATVADRRVDYAG